MTFNRFLCNIVLYSIGPASITKYIHNWVLFLLWLHPFILSGVISSLISSSILGTCRPGEFLFHYPIILPFHTAHGVLKARILKWMVISFSSGSHSVRVNSRVNVNILGISKLKWTGMGEYNSDDHYIYHLGKNPLEEIE